MPTSQLPSLPTLWRCSKAGQFGSSGPSPYGQLSSPYKASLRAEVLAQSSLGSEDAHWCGLVKAELQKDVCLHDGY